MTETITKEQYQVFLQRERQIFDELQGYFLEFGGARFDTSNLRQVMASLNDPFLLVVVGEFNAGKSTCINVLLGEGNLVEAGELPTTNQITIIRYAEKQGKSEADDIVYIQSKAELLQHYSIVDTPGVNAVLHRHQRITEDFIPRSDLIFFVTAADRPFADSERVFLERIYEWGKKIVIILNKIDHLEESASSQKTVDFVREKCKELLGFEPQIFPTSARIAKSVDAARGRQAARLWTKSGFGALESYLLQTLDDSARLSLKLLTPLEGMQYLLRSATPSVNQHGSLLDDYNQSVNSIIGKLNLYCENMNRDLSHSLSEIENIILEMRARGDHFFDEKMRIGNLFQLFNSKSIREAFEREVIDDSEDRIANVEKVLRERFLRNNRQLQQDIGDMLDQLQATQNSFDRLVEHEHRFKQSILAELARLSHISLQQDNEIIGDVDKQLEEDRNDIILQVRDTADEMAEIRNYMDVATGHLKKLQGQTTGSTLAGISAGGLGVLAVPLLGAIAVEAGALFGIVLLGFGVYSIEDKRKKSKQDFDVKVEEWRTTRRNPLRDRYHEELRSATGQMQRIIEQYSKYTSFEQERTAEMRQQIVRLTNNIVELENEINSTKQGK